MNKIGVVVVLLAEALSGSALAADLPTRKPAPYLPPVAAAPFSWTGFYFGGTLGYGFANSPQLFGVSSATLVALPPVIPTVESSGSQNMALRGALLGDEVGYNWQTSGGFVVGAEADSEWSRMMGSTSNGGSVPLPAPYPFPVIYNIAQQSAPDWQGSLRLRVGYTPVQPLLLYATGGLALAHYHYTSFFNDNYSGEAESVFIHAIKPGWTLGVGAEYALAANWSLKGEYRYSQFAAATGSGQTLLTDGSTAYATHSTGVLKESEVKVGLNYLFH